MIIAADEVARSLAGALDLLQRRAQGLRRFDPSRRGAWRSVAAFLLLAPAFVTWLAAERASRGLLLPGAGLFDDPALALDVLAKLIVWSATLPVLALALVRLMRPSAPFAPFLVACNWSNILGGALLCLPAFLFAEHLATAELAMFYSFAFLLVVAHLRWFIAKTALGLSGGLAAVLVAGDLVTEILLSRLV